MKTALAALALTLALMTTAVQADSKLGFTPADTVAAVLTRQAGQSVELRLKSGEKISGKLEKVGEKLVHLSQLTGQEFYEAAVAIEEIAAVVVRAK